MLRESSTVGTGEVAKGGVGTLSIVTEIALNCGGKSSELWTIFAKSFYYSQVHCC